MPSVNPKTNLDGIVYVEPVHLKPGYSFKDVQAAMNLFSRTLLKHKVAPGFLAGFVVLDNREGETEPAILLTLFWQSQTALDATKDNPLYQVLLDDVLAYCLSLDGNVLRAPNIPDFLSVPHAQNNTHASAQSNRVH